MDKFTETAKQDMVKALSEAANRIKNRQDTYICLALSSVLDAPFRREMVEFLHYWIEVNLEGEDCYLGWATAFDKSLDDIRVQRIRWINWMLDQIEGQAFDESELPTSVSFAEVEAAWFSRAI